jgi:hypothetical protein
MSNSGKVHRQLTIILEPMRGQKFSVTTVDSTSRSKEGERKNESVRRSDIWSAGAASDSFGEVLKAFTKTLKDEDPGELFAEENSAKPKLDKK